METAMSCCHQPNLQPPTFSCSHRCYTSPPSAADPHLHCPRPFPAPSDPYSGSFSCPDSSYGQFQKRLNQQEFYSPPHHHPPEPQSQNQCSALSSLIRRIDVLESSFLRSSPPPTPLTLRDFAARTIQARFRVFLIRRLRAFRAIKELAYVKSNLDALNSSIPLLDSSSLSREAMILIGRLETIQGVDKMTKEGKVLILRDFAQWLEVVEGMICVRRNDVSSKTFKDIRMARNDDNSRVSCANRLIDELRERVKRIQEVSEVMEVKDDNNGKHVQFVEYSTTWVHNFDEYKKEAMSIPSDEYGATRVHNFDEFSKEVMVRPSDDDDTAVYSATMIHDFDEYREECMSIPSDRDKNTADAAEKQHEDDGEVESEDEGEENGTLSNDLSQETDDDVEETVVESDEVSEDEDDEDLESEIEGNPDEWGSGDELGEDVTEYESSEYENEDEEYEDEDEIENEGCEDETEDEDGEGEDETEKGTHNDIPQDNKQTCANVPNSANLYATKVAADAMSGNRRMKNVICHQCYKRGHMKRNCWFNPARRCRDCNMLGHTREICTHFSDQQNQNAQNS